MILNTFLNTYIFFTIIYFSLFSIEKYKTLNALSFFLVFSLIFLLIIFIKLYKEKFQFNLKKILNNPLSGFGLLILLFYISAFKNLDVLYVKFDLFKFIFFYCFFIICYFTKINRKYLFYIISFIMLYSLAYALLQRFYTFNLQIQQIYSMNLIVHERLLSRLQSYRVFSIFILPNIFASFLALNIPVLFVLKNKYIKVFTTILFFFVLLLTKTLSTIISLLIVFIILYLKNKNKRKFKLKYIIFLIIFIISASIYSINTRGWKNIMKYSIQNHLKNYITTINMIRKDKLKGIGFGVFRQNYAKEYHKEKGNINAIKYAHNFYLQTILETGISGLLIILLILYQLIKNIYLLNNNKNYIFLIPVLYFFINNLFFFDSYILSILIYFALYYSIYLKNIRNNDK